MKLKLSKYGDYDRVVKFPVWGGYEIHVVFTDDIHRSHLARYGMTVLIPKGEVAGLHATAEGGNAHVYFKIGKCPSGTVAHEAWHAIRAMMVDYAGVEIMENEMTAYHLGYLVNQISELKYDLMDSGIYPEVKPELYKK